MPRCLFPACGRVALASLVMLASIAGCGDRRSSPRTAGSQAAPTSLLQSRYEFDHPSVLSGDLVPHFFRVTNSTDSVWEVRSDQDIMPNCGCVELKPLERVLRPHQTIAVVVRINTAQRSGSVTGGGRIRWTSREGDVCEQEFVVHVQVTARLAVEPTILRFSPEEIRAEKPQSWKISPNIGIVEDSLSVAALSPQIIVSPVRREGRVYQCEIRCRLPEGVSKFQDFLVITAQEGHGRGGAPGSSSTVTIPVFAEQQVGLTVTPTVLAVELDANQRGHARLLLAGDLVKSTADTTTGAVTTEGCPAGSAKCVMTATGSRIALFGCTADSTKCEDQPLLTCEF